MSEEVDIIHEKRQRAVMVRNLQNHDAFLAAASEAHKALLELEKDEPELGTVT